MTIMDRSPISHQVKYAVEIRIKKRLNKNIHDHVFKVTRGRLNRKKIIDYQFTLPLARVDRTQVLPGSEFQLILFM